MVPPLTLCAYMKKGPNLRWSLIQCSGGDEGDRTPDLLTASQALSQLSYTPTYCGKPQRNSGVLTGIRTPVPTVKGSCPRPLDDEDNL